jgi:hypothetical protein
MLFFINALRVSLAEEAAALMLVYPFRIAVTDFFPRLFTRLWISRGGRS